MKESITLTTNTNNDKSPDRDNLKIDINKLIWMYGDSDLTLAEGEDRACQILNIICEAASY